MLAQAHASGALMVTMWLLKLTDPDSALAARHVRALVRVLRVVRLVVGLGRRRARAPREPPAEARAPAGDVDEIYLDDLAVHAWQLARNPAQQ